MVGSRLASQTAHITAGRRGGPAPQLCIPESMKYDYSRHNSGGSQILSCRSNKGDRNVLTIVISHTRIYFRLKTEKHYSRHVAQGRDIQAGNLQGDIVEWLSSDRISAPVKTDQFHSVAWCKQWRWWASSPAREGIRNTRGNASPIHYGSTGGNRNTESALKRTSTLMKL